MSLFRLLTALMLVAPLLALARQDAAPDARQLAVRAHVRALETAGNGSLDEALARFDAERFSPAFLARTPPAERRRLLEAVRNAGRDVGDVRLARRGDELVLTLAGQRTADVPRDVRRRLLVVAQREPGGARRLRRRDGRRVREQG